MTDERDLYCAECGIVLLAIHSEHGLSWEVRPVTCVPCGQRCCDRQCLADHKRHCYAAKEAKERRQAARRPAASLAELMQRGVIRGVYPTGGVRGQ